MHSNEFKLTFSDTIEAVCKYAAMYTMNGTFGEALALLDGYANGARLGNPNRSSSYFGDFANWLQKRLDQSRHEDFWRYFRDSYPDDATALAEFNRLWQEYELTSHPSVVSERR